MPMKNVSSYLFRYLEAKRHLWNTYFADLDFDLRECDPLDHFEEIDRRLFLSLVRFPLGFELPTDFRFGQDPVTNICVKPRTQLADLQMHVAERIPSHGVRYKLEENIPYTSRTRLNFIEFYEWDRYKQAPYSYVRVMICRLPARKEWNGLEGLVRTANVEFWLAEGR